MHGRALLWIPVVAMLTAAGGGPVLIKLGTVAPDGSPWQQLLREMEQDWTRQTQGQVTVRIYPGGVLGDETDLVKKLRIGQLHAVALSGAGMEHLEPAVMCLQMPLMFDSYAELDHVRDAVAPMLEARLLKKGFVVLNWSDAGWVQFFTKKPAFTPSDIRAMKLFTSAADEQTLQTYKAAGFKPVPLATSDMQTALTTGMIDAFDVPPLLALLNQWFPSAPNLADIKWAPLIGATIVSQKTWDKVPADKRDSLKQSATALGITYRDRIRKLSEDSVAAMQKRGLTLNHVNAAQRQEWEKEAAGAWKALRGTSCPEDIFDQVKRLRDEYRASHPGGP